MQAQMLKLPVQSLEVSRRGVNVGPPQVRKTRMAVPDQPEAHPQQCPTSSHSQLCHPQMSCLTSHQTCKGQTSCLRAEGITRPDIPSPSPGSAGDQGWSCLGCPRAPLLPGQGGGTGPAYEALPCPSGKPPLLMWHPGTSRQWRHFPRAS